ncbi:DUF3043 domain-containing protein [Nocardia sp. CDC159]|uniref:DUF3043 domain-containing protein n=1 Tax=Nocardia pulmonis TaxID=2951408 RepID=A0A9X2IX30_9NOCA|nr:MULTISPECIES: DUF3043 domain-containing protein [Nocardia]MCM6773410.1 DUF3043 domain-containing protein [Nocardia pulmonis]MCM6786297.1 DUF3043 domain-containing protein [Nocardia sp. CDC159]
MKFLRRGDASTTDDLADETSAATSDDSDGGSATSNRSAATAGKGRPTPKRRDAQGRRRGPVAPAPMTAKEARARRKAARGTRAERKAAAAERRRDAADRRQRMLAGEDKYLLPRDRGPVRAYVRDLVDARRNLVGLFMPLALLMIMTMFLAPVVQGYVTLGMTVMFVFMLGEGVLLGRTINRRVRERFPEHTDRPFSLGWYAFVRASQIRRMRAPKPRVNPGDAV